MIRQLLALSINYTAPAHLSRLLSSDLKVSLNKFLGITWRNRLGLSISFADQELNSKPTVEGRTEDFTNFKFCNKEQ